MRSYPPKFQRREPRKGARAKPVRKNIASAPDLAPKFPCPSISRASSGRRMLTVPKAPPNRITKPDMIVGDDALNSNIAIDRPIKPKAATATLKFEKYRSDAIIANRLTTCIGPKKEATRIAISAERLRSSRIGNK